MQAEKYDEELPSPVPVLLLPPHIAFVLRAAIFPRMPVTSRLALRAISSALISGKALTTREYPNPLTGLPVDTIPPPALCMPKALFPTVQERKRRARWLEMEARDEDPCKASHKVFPLSQSEKAQPSTGLTREELSLIAASRMRKKGKWEGTSLPAVPIPQCSADVKKRHGETLASKS